MIKKHLGLCASIVVCLAACTNDLKPIEIAQEEKQALAAEANKDFEFDSFLNDENRRNELATIFDNIMSIHLLSEKKLRSFESELDKNSQTLSESEAWKDLQVLRALEEKKSLRLSDYYLRLVKMASTQRPNAEVRKAEQIIETFEARLHQAAKVSVFRNALFEVGIMLRRVLTDYYAHERQWSEAGVEKVLRQRLGFELMNIISASGVGLAGYKVAELTTSEKKKTPSIKMDSSLQKEFKTVKKEFFGKNKAKEPR